MPQAKNRHQVVITALLVYTMEPIRLTHFRVFYEDKRECHLTVKVGGTPTVVDTVDRYDYWHRRFSCSSTIAATKLRRRHEIKSWSPVKTSVPWSLYVQFYVFYKLCVCMCWRKQETFRHGYSGHMPMDWTPTAWFADPQESWIGRKWTVCSGGSAENNPSNIANNHFNQVGFMTIIIDFDHQGFYLQ